MTTVRRRLEHVKDQLLNVFAPSFDISEQSALLASRFSQLLAQRFDAIAVMKFNFLQSLRRFGFELLESLLHFVIELFQSFDIRSAVVFAINDQRNDESSRH